jgi:fructokinase
LLSLARRTRAVCFGTLAQRSAVTRATIRRFIAAMSASALKVFDINLRQSFYNRKMIKQLLAVSNVLKLNDEELLVVSDLLSIPGGENRIVRNLMFAYKLRVVAVTRGDRGAVLYCPEGTYPVKGGKIRVVDTVGAGDAFTAGLVVGLLKGLKMETIAKLANDLASYVCGRRGATPPLPAKMTPK